MKMRRDLSNRLRAAATGSQRGAATLVIVLMLFFVVALVAAYTNRNLIFEQRTSVNQYRSTMAFEAADAGLEWAVAMLNAGRIGDNCEEATAVAGSTSFRQRYLSTNQATGLITPNRQPDNSDLSPTCVWTGTAWQCNCPSTTDPVLAAPTSAGLHPAFRLRFRQGSPAAGVVRVDVNGCVRMTEECLDDFSNVPRDSEGRAQHTAMLALKPALETPPAATMTVWGNVLGGGAARFENADTASGGLTIHAAGGINIASFAVLSTPGTPGNRSTVASDGTLVPDGLTLAGLQALPRDELKWDRVFGSVFGLLPDSYQNQPAAKVLVCPSAGCRQDLADLVARNPDRVVWVQGDLVLESAGDIGSLPDPANPAAAGPALIVVEGKVQFLASGVRIFGVVYSRDGAWEGNGLIQGAAMAEGDLGALAAPDVVYDQTIIDALRRSSGSFVPLNGDWKDFK